MQQRMASVKVERPTSFVKHSNGKPITDFPFAKSRTEQRRHAEECRMMYESSRKSSEGSDGHESNTVVKQQMRQVVGDLENVLGELKTVVVDLRVLMNQIDVVTNKIDEKYGGKWEDNRRYSASLLEGKLSAEARAKDLAHMQKSKSERNFKQASSPNMRPVYINVNINPCGIPSCIAIDSTVAKPRANTPAKNYTVCEEDKFKTLKRRPKKTCDLSSQTDSSRSSKGRREPKRLRRKTNSTASNSDSASCSKTRGGGVFASNPFHSRCSPCSPCPDTESYCGVYEKELDQRLELEFDEDLEIFDTLELDGRTLNPGYMGIHRSQYDRTFNTWTSYSSGLLSVESDEYHSPSPPCFDTNMLNENVMRLLNSQQRA